MSKNEKPLARKNEIVVQELNGEILIYDLRKNKSFCLNESSAIIWKACDGEKSIEEIAKSIGNEDMVWFALEQFKRQNLLTSNNEIANKFAGLSRREIIKKIGLSSMMALPIITSLVAPVAAQTASACAAPSNRPLSCACTSSSQCASSCCKASGGGANTCTNTGSGSCL